MKLFTYGTLTRRGRLEALAGQPLAEPVAARLEGYSRYLTSHGYPVILPDPNGVVEGLLWEIEEAGLAELDHYEGSDEQPPYYFRATVTVQSSQGTVQAQAYIGNPEVWHNMEDLQA